jgi:hypothetical protein
MLALRTELDRHQFGGLLAHAVTDVVAMDDEGVAAIVSAAHDQMDVGIVSVPVINPDPIQPRTEVVLHLFEEVTGKGSKVLHLGCVLGTDDEPEMMPVITVALGEGAQIGVVRRCVEHAGGRAIPGDALASQIREMRPNRTGSTETLSDDAGLYDHPARTITVEPSLCGAPGGHAAAAAARAGMPGWGSCGPVPANMACELRRGEDLRDEQLWGPLPALETTELGVELVVFEHSAGETQPIRGLRPKDGTVPSRRHGLKPMCRPWKSSGRALGAAPSSILRSGLHA